MQHTFYSEKYFLRLLFAFQLLALCYSTGARPLVGLPVEVHPADTLKILSWNIQMLPGIVFYKGQAKRAHAIVDQLKSSSYDIIVFQEAFHRKARKILRKGLEKSYPEQFGPGKGGFMKFNSGVWIVSVLPLNNGRIVKFKRCNYPLQDCRANKSAVFVEVTKGNQRFQVIGTHVQASEGTKYQQTRNSQFSEISEHLLKPLAIEHVPQLVIGDLNTAKKKIEDYNKMLSILEVEDGELLGENKFTYDTRTNDFTGSGGEYFKVIDYALVNKKGLKSLKVKRKVVIIQQQWHRKMKDLSDHYAVEVELYY